VLTSADDEDRDQQQNNRSLVHGRQV
jgi:hypothetical protein